MALQGQATKQNQYQHQSGARVTSQGQGWHCRARLQNKTSINTSQVQGSPVRGKGGIAGPGYETKSVSTPVRGTGVHVHVFRSLYPGHVNCMDTTTYIDRLLFFKTKHRGILHVSVYILA